MADKHRKSEAAKAGAQRAATLERWSNDIELFAGEVQMMHARRQVFDRYDAELEYIGQEAGPAGESALWFRHHYLRPTYGEAQAVAIRRLIDTDRRTRSLVRLLSEMIEHPEYLSRERYIELFFSRRDGKRDEDDLRLAHDLFDDVAGPDAEHIPAEKLEEMGAGLIAAGERIKAHVDQYVAHRDRNPDFEPATWDDLRTAIDGMADALALVGRAVDGRWRRGDPTFQFEWYEFMQRPLFQRAIDDPQLQWPEYSVSFS